MNYIPHNVRINTVVTSTKEGKGYWKTKYTPDILCENNTVINEPHTQ